MTINIDPFLARIRQKESGGDDRARNPLPGQSASGRYQFTRDTWAGVVRNYGQSHNLSPDGVFDGEQQERAMRAIVANEYIPLIQRAGREVTGEEIYRVHMLGYQGYQRLAGAGDTPAAEALRGARNDWNAVFTNNRGVFRDSDISAAEAFNRIGEFYNRPKAGGGPRQVSRQGVAKTSSVPSPVPALPPQASASTPATSATPASTPTKVSWLASLVQRLRSSLS